jgi:NIMA (never in mitosis gene a)-related kinase
MATETETPTDLGDYTVEKKAGKGQFSTVYKAIRNNDKLEVALKKVAVEIYNISCCGAYILTTPLVQIFELMDAKARADCMKEIQLLKVDFF